jgi:hypothetical protein
MARFPHLLPPSEPGEPVPRPALPPGPRPVLDRPPCPGFICEVCFDAPAVVVQPAPGGGERGVCEACRRRREGIATDAAPREA